MTVGALVASGERLIGTGQTDYAAYAIASKRTGRFDSHANLGYNINGQPPGVKLVNTFSGALATEFHVSHTVGLFGEVLGTTSSAGEGGGDTRPIRVSSRRKRRGEHWSARWASACRPCRTCCSRWA